MTITLPHNFEAYTYQKPFFRAMNLGTKRAALVWHRRAGKDVCAWQYMIMQAVKRKGLYYYVFPTFKQGRRVLWDGMTEDGFSFLEYMPKELVRSRNSLEMKLLIVNGSIIQIVGSDRYDDLRGSNACGCIFSEYSWHKPEAWSLVLEPQVSKQDGWAIFVYTPAGTNHSKQMYDMAIDNPSWFCQLLTVDDTTDFNGKPIFSKEKIQSIRDEGITSEDMIQQEYYCSFTLGIAGSYFARYLREIRDDERICRVPHDKNCKVFSAWDIGYDDDTAIVLFQLVKNEIHFIGCYRNRQQPLEHYVQFLTSLGYIYGGHYGPHDANAHSMSAGLSVKEVGAGLGFDFTILPTLEWTHPQTIECARTMFNRLWIDEKSCKDLIIALENYRSEYDREKDFYKPKPVHDRFSHFADAFRYAAIAIKLYCDGKQGPDDEGYEKMRDIYLPRFK